MEVQLSYFQADNALWRHSFIHQAIDALIEALNDLQKNDLNPKKEKPGEQPRKFKRVHASEPKSDTPRVCRYLGPTD